MAAARASNDRPPGAGGLKRARQQQEAAGARVTVVLGAQWGDEGKGKVVDLLATDADIVSRCQVRGPPSPGPPTAPHDPGSAAGHLPSAAPPLTRLPSLRGTPFPRDPAFPTPIPAGRRAINTSPAELGTPDPQGGGVLPGGREGTPAPGWFEDTRRHPIPHSAWAWDWAG